MILVMRGVSMTGADLPDGVVRNAVATVILNRLPRLKSCGRPGTPSGLGQIPGGPAPRATVRVALKLFNGQSDCHNGKTDPVMSGIRDEIDKGGTAQPFRFNEMPQGRTLSRVGDVVNVIASWSNTPPAFRLFSRATDAVSTRLVRPNRSAPGCLGFALPKQSGRRHGSVHLATTSLFA
jgi:hypothetical protein